MTTDAPVELWFHEHLHDLFEERDHDWFVGVDDMLESWASAWDEMARQHQPTPTSVIERLNDREYRIRIEVPGYDRDDLAVSLVGDDGILVTGARPSRQDRQGRPMPPASFERRYLLARGGCLESAHYNYGTLTIDVSFPAPVAPTTVEVPIA